MDPSETHRSRENADARMSFEEIQSLAKRNADRVSGMRKRFGENAASGIFPSPDHAAEYLARWESRLDEAIARHREERAGIDADSDRDIAELRTKQVLLSGSSENPIGPTEDIFPASETHAQLHHGNIIDPHRKSRKHDTMQKFQYGYRVNDNGMPISGTSFDEETGENLTENEKIAKTKAKRDRNEPQNPGMTVF
jgi:hypothetical protein